MNPHSFTRATVTCTVAIVVAAGSARTQVPPADANRDFGAFAVSAHIVNDSDLTLRIVWKNGKAVSLTIPDFAGGITPEMLHVHGANLLLVEAEQSHADAVFVVDAEAGRVVADVGGLGTVLSPDKRYIAFERGSSNGLPWYDSVYLVYDVQQSPATNRMANGTCWGLAVYPPENAAQRTCHAASTEEEAHTRTSSILWISDTEFIVGDRWQLKDSLILVDLAQGVNQARVHSVLLDPRIGYRIAGAGIRMMSFFSRDRDSVTISLDDFDGIKVRIPTR